MRLFFPLAIGLALAACGDDGGNAKTHDAGVSDGLKPIDAAIGVDAAPAPVTLNVTTNGSATPNVVVYFQNADSSTVSETMTDASGNASAVMAAGGFVTALVPQVQEPLVTGFQDVNPTTFAGVKPGDHLTIQAPFAPVNDQNVNFTAPLYQNSDSYQYKLLASCDGSQISLEGGSGLSFGSGGLPANCATADITEWATSGSGGGPVAVAYDANQAITANTDLRTNIGAFAAPLAIETSFTDFPTGVTGVEMSQSLITTNGAIPGYQTAFFVVDGATAGGTFNQANITGAHTLTSTQLVDGNAYGLQTILEVGSGGGSSYALDVGSNELPYFSASLSGSAFNTTTHAFTWAESTGTLTPDLGVATISINDATNEWNWTIAAPRTGTTITFPVLPTDLYNYNALAADTVSFEGLETFKVPGGYDAIRPYVFDEAPPLALLGTSGRVSSQRYQSVSLRSAHRPHASHLVFGVTAARRSK